MLGYLSADIICSEKRTFFGRKTVSFEERMHNVQGQNPSIFLPPTELLCSLSFKYFSKH